MGITGRGEGNHDRKSKRGFWKTRLFREKNLKGYLGDIIISCSVGFKVGEIKKLHDDTKEEKD